MVLRLNHEFKFWLRVLEVLFNSIGLSFVSSSSYAENPIFHTSVKAWLHSCLSPRAAANKKYLKVLVRLFGSFLSLQHRFY